MNNEIKKAMFHKGSGMFPKFLFAGFAIIGGILIWGLKIIGVNQYVAVLIPVSFIIIYCILACNSRLFFLSEERIGDNAYYLGFLYTLSSLSYALHSFLANPDAPEYIISSFGVALWSTIVGICCRVYLAQLRQDPNDIEKEARVRISETASILSSELHQAAMSFNTFRMTIQQSMEEAFIKINEKSEESFMSSMTKISDATDTITAHISTHFEELSGNAKKLCQSSTKIVNSLDKMNDKIENALSSFESFGSNLDTITHDQIRVTDSMSSAIGTLVANVKSLSSDITSVKTLSDSLIASRQGIDDATNKLGPDLERFSEQLSAIAQKQESVVNSISNHADELRDQLKRSREYTEKTHKSLSEMTRKLADELE